MPSLSPHPHKHSSSITLLTVNPTPQTLHPKTLTLPYWVLILSPKHLETEKTNHKKAKNNLLPLVKGSFWGLKMDNNSYLDHQKWNDLAFLIHKASSSDHRLPLQISPGENLVDLNFDLLPVEAPLHLVGSELNLVVDTSTEDLHSKKRLTLHNVSQEIRMCTGDRI